MAPPVIGEDLILEALRAVRAHGGNQCAAAAFLGIPRGTLQGRLRRAQITGVTLDPLPVAEEPKPVSLDRVRSQLRSPISLADLAARVQCTRGAALDAIDALKAAGYAVIEARIGGDLTYRVNTAPLSAVDASASPHKWVSAEDGSYTFGFLSDTHLGSKYTRLDVLDALFDRFAEVGVTRVLHAGNWIEGEGHDNVHDLTHHGVHQQCKFLAERWPRIGVTTYAVTGNDHEGWYAKREGLDVGAYAQQRFRDIGRDDWVDLGYMEADLALTHFQTGAISRLRVAHPGGGSSYAHSYAPQKYMESLSGGEKPAVVLLGHWHKLSCNNIRGSWVIQTGCTQDQTPWSRGKRLDFHVGGGVCRLVQDPDSGAILSCTVELMQFFNREFYGTGRWSPHGDVLQAERAIAA